MSYRRVRTAASYVFSVHSNIDDAALVLDRLLASFPEQGLAEESAVYALWETGEGRERFTLTLDGAPIQRVEHAGSMVDWLVIDVTRKAVERSEGYLSIHAGVVSSDGRAIILPAEPSSGKTTTVAGLVRAGYSYLSDEVALLRLADARIDPFPRPLVMDDSSIDAVNGLREELPSIYEGFRGRWFHVAPDDLRPGATGDVSVPACIVAPRYTEGATTTLRRLTRGETLFVLAEHSFDLAKAGAEGLAVLQRVAQRVPGYELVIGDMRSAVQAVTDLMESDPLTAARSR